MTLVGRLSARLYSWSSWRSFIAITLVYAFFIASVMPQESTNSQRYAGDWGAPDRHLIYTPQELYTAIGAWDAEGRQSYIRFRLGLDIIWALAYTGFLVSAISCLLRYSGRALQPSGQLNAFPLLVMLTDYAENALGIILVSQLPSEHYALAWLAACFTTLKWSLLGIAHLILLIALGLALMRLNSTRRA